MKGMILKDFYMLGKYHRMFIILLAALFGAAIISAGDSFLVIYGCVLTGTLPVSLMSYDDREGWCKYCMALPVTRAEYVRARYVVGLICMAAAVGLSALSLIPAAAPRALLAALFPCLPLISLLPTAICAPLFLRFGAEKGRMLYIVVIIAACSGAGLISAGSSAASIAAAMSPAVALCVLALTAALYAASYALSVRAYASREA